MVDRETFDLIRNKHGEYASWAVWGEQTGGPKSRIGDMDVLDPDKNPMLLATLRNDIVMLGLNRSRSAPGTYFNFHPQYPEAQDCKIRYAFAGTPGAYMTGLIKEFVELKASNLVRQLDANPSLVSRNVNRLLGELDDLKCDAPTLIAFGGDVYKLARKYVPRSRYSRLIRVPHYSHYISKEEYRERVLAELAA
jgi:hypothetical protein